MGDTDDANNIQSGGDVVSGMGRQLWPASLLFMAGKKSIKVKVAETFVIRWRVAVGGLQLVRTDTPPKCCHYSASNL